MKNALFFVLSGAVGVILFDALLTPFLSSFFRELGIRPDNWGAPAAHWVLSMIQSERLVHGIYGGFGALFGLLLKNFGRAFLDEYRKKAGAGTD